MSITFKQPLNYPAALLKRSYLPNFLHIVVRDINFPITTQDDRNAIANYPGTYNAKKSFEWGDLNIETIRSHLKHTTWETGQLSSFISIYEGEAMALKQAPFSSTLKKSSHQLHAVQLILDTDSLVPAWAEISPGEHIPIWVEQGQLPKLPKGVLHVTLQGFDAFEASLWVCVEELRVVLGLKETNGEVGEWLACGYVPQSRVCARSRLHGVKTAEHKLSDEQLRQAFTVEERKASGRCKEEQMMLPSPESLTPTSACSSLLRLYRSNNELEPLESTDIFEQIAYGSPEATNERMNSDAQSLLRPALTNSLEKETTMSLLTEAKVTVRQAELGVAELRGKDQPMVPQTVTDIPRISRQTCCKAAQELRHDAELQKQDVRPSATPDLPTTPSLPEHERPKRVMFASTNDCSDRTQSDVEFVMADLVHTNLPHCQQPPSPDVFPISPILGGASTLNPLTIPCLERIQALLEEGVKLRQRRAAIQVLQEEVKQQHKKDLADHASKFLGPGHGRNASIMGARLELDARTTRASRKRQF